jgi:hypothetical protein
LYGILGSCKSKVCPPPPESVQDTKFLARRFITPEGQEAGLQRQQQKQQTQANKKARAKQTNTTPGVEVLRGKGRPCWGELVNPDLDISAES